MGIVYWSPVCTAIGVLNLLVFLLQCYPWGISLLPAGSAGLEAYACPADGAAWYQLVTAIFLHASWQHLTGNAFFLFAFGTCLEKTVGWARFLVIYLLSGIAGNLLHVLFLSGNTALIGASGAIFGIICSLVFLDYKALVVTPGSPLPMPIFIFAPLYVLNEVFLMGGRGDGGLAVSHLAHIGGGLGGAIVGWGLLQVGTRK